MTWSVREIILNFPVDDVFDLMCDFERLAQAMPNLQKIEFLSKHRRGVGVRTRWTSSVGFNSSEGQIMVWEEEVTAYRENELLGFTVLTPQTPFTGFLRVYPYAMGTKTFLIFAENHPYEGADMKKIRGMMMGQLQSMKHALTRDHDDTSQTTP